MKASTLKILVTVWGVMAALFLVNLAAFSVVPEGRQSVETFYARIYSFADELAIGFAMLGVALSIALSIIKAWGGFD